MKENNEHHCYNFWYCIFATANASLGSMFFIYVVVTSGPLYHWFQNHLFPEEGRFVCILMTSCTIFTALIGSLIAGKLCLKIGRRLPMIIFDIIAVAGVIVCLFDSVACIFVGRLLIGFTIGISNVAVSLYFTEIVPVYFRGQFSNGPTIFGAFGVLIGALLSLLMPTDLPYGDPNNNMWRVLIGVSMVPLVLRILGFITIFKFETPFYYVHKLDYRKAAKKLKKVVTEGDISERMTEILNERDYIQTKGQVKYYEIFKKRFRMAVFVCSVLASFQYLSGLNIVLVHLGTVMEWGLGENKTSAYVLVIITALINLFSSFTSIWTTSQFGRRPLIIGGILAIACLFTIYGILAQAIGPGSLVAKIWLIFWPIPWNFSSGSILHLVLAEALPDAAFGVTSIFNWTFAWLTWQFFPNTIDALGLGWTFIMFGLICLGGSIFFYFMLVESQHKNKDSVLRLYSGKIHPARKDKKAIAEAHAEAQSSVKEVEVEHLENIRRRAQRNNRQHQSIQGRQTEETHQEIAVATEPDSNGTQMRVVTEA